MIVRDAGTAHLMAIPELRIAFAALLTTGLIHVGQSLISTRWICWQMPLVDGIVCVTFYVWLTGLRLPALRTVVALLIWGALRLSGRQWSGWPVWICCLATIVVMDPATVPSQSLRLSTFAVTALLLWYQWVPLPGWPLSRAERQLLTLAHLQLGITLLLLPMQITMFHGFNLTLLLANLFAVPLVTFVSISSVLTGTIVHLAGMVMVKSSLWYLADRSLALLFWMFRSLPEGWINIDARWQWLVFLPGMTVIAWRLNILRTLPMICSSVFLLLSGSLWHVPHADVWQVHMLNVGQGLAIVTARNGKALFYDVGLAWPEGDSTQYLIIPWLHWHNLESEEIILSHEHMDHCGGLHSL